MTEFRRFEIIESIPSFPAEDELHFALHLLNPNPRPALFDLPSPFDYFHTITDLVQIERTPLYTSTRRVQRTTELYLQSLFDQVSALELRFRNAKKPCGGDRKYTWTTEIKSPEKDGVDRKYEWTAEIKGRKKKKKGGGVEKKYKWTAEIKGKGENAPPSRIYTLKASTGNAGECTESKIQDKNDAKKKTVVPARLVKIEESNDHGAVVLRQAFAKRAGAVEKSKGKRNELSPQDAATAIQINFRAYLIRRSQALRALRDLAVAKTKLKEIRALFNNFSYRRRVAGDAEERQRFSERIIVLLLTVDAIEGADLMVRAAKKPMVDELEAMLDVVDPQPQGRSLSMKEDV